MPLSHLSVTPYEEFEEDVSRLMMCSAWYTEPRDTCTMSVDDLARQTWSAYDHALRMGKNYARYLQARRDHVAVELDIVEK